jgi:hypothetical protein
MLEIFWRLDANVVHDVIQSLGVLTVELSLVGELLPTVLILVARNGGGWKRC